MNFPLRIISRPWRMETKEKVMSWKKKRKEMTCFSKLTKNAWIFQICMISNTLKCHFDDVVLKKSFRTNAFFSCQCNKKKVHTFFTLHLQIVFENQSPTEMSHDHDMPFDSVKADSSSRSICKDTWYSLAM